VKSPLFEFLSSHLHFGLCDFAISPDLDEGDIELLKTYGQGQYHKSIKTIEDDIQKAIKQVNELTGIKESDTGLAPPALWDLAADKQTLQNEQPLQVARCTKIINADTDDPKYIINVKQFAKFVVDLADSVAPTDIEEGMRVGVDRNKYQIHIPLPPKIDPTVTMMQVEDKPDVTYSDVGGCKEQIEKLREVVETPLLHVSWILWVEAMDFDEFLVISAGKIRHARY
jgi:26S proteasome regulatory subunit T1